MSKQSFLVFIVALFMFMFGLFAGFFMTGAPAVQAVRSAFCVGYSQGVNDSARETGEHLIFRCGR